MSDPLTELSTDDAAVSPLLQQLGSVLLSAYTVETAVELVISLASTTIPDVVGAGVTLIDERGKRTTAASDEFVRRADELQYRYDNGPCLTAWRDQTVVRVDDVGSDRRWPEWAHEAVELGVRSVLSAPMLVSGGALGAIKIYSDRRRAFGSEPERVLLLFARQAAVLLANMQSLAEAREARDEIVNALDTRDVIGQAKGVLIARGAVDDAAAFRMLIDVSQRSNRKLRDVATELVQAVVDRNTGSNRS